MSDRVVLAIAVSLSLSLAVGCSTKPGGSQLLSSFNSSPKSVPNSGYVGEDKLEEFAKKLRAEETGESTGGAFAAAASATNSIGGAIKKATASVSGALSVKPKVIPADDPISLASNPGELDSNIYYQAGRLAERNGNLPAAEKQYRRALAKDPKDVRTLISLARLQDRQEKFAQAIQLYQQAAKTAPDNAMVHNDLGLCYARQKQHAKSVESLKLAVALEPERKLYRNNLATVLVDMGETDEAWKTLTAVHSPAISHYNMGYLLNRAGRKKEAYDRFALAWNADPSMVVAKSMVDKLGKELGSGVAAARRPVAQRPGARTNAVAARPATHSPAAGPAKIPARQVSSPLELRRTPPPRELPPAPPKQDSQVKLRGPVPISSRGPVEPVVRPAAEPLPQPTNLRFPIRATAAYSIRSEESDDEIALPTPDQLYSPTDILADEPGLLTDG